MMLASQGLTMIAAFIAAILVARTLDPEQWGVFSAFFGLGIALGLFVEFGLATWLLRELSVLFALSEPESNREGNRLSGIAFTSALCVTGVVVIVGTAAASFFVDSFVNLIALSLFLLYGGIFASANVLESNLRSRRRLRTVLVASVLEKYLLILLLGLAVVTHLTLWKIGAAYVCAGTMRIGYLGVAVSARRFCARPHLGEMVSVWRRSFPFALMSGSFTVVPKLDAVILLSMSAISAGYYALGDRMLSMAVVAAAIGSVTMFPFLARRTHSRGSVWALSASFGLVGAVLALVGILTAPTLVPKLFGTQYTSAVETVQIMLLSLPLAYASNPLITASLSRGLERRVATGSLAGALTGTVAIVLGQLKWGSPGAGLGAVLRAILGLAIAVTIVATSRPESDDAGVVVVAVEGGGK